MLEGMNAGPGRPVFTSRQLQAVLYCACQYRPIASTKSFPGMDWHL